jgi:hypothetical protein
MQHEQPPTPRRRRAKRDAAPPAPYEAQFEADLAAIFRATDGTLDLTGEIRFMRTALAALDPLQIREASAAMGALRQLVETQMKLTGAGADTEHELEEAAERVLRALEIEHA